MDVLTRGNEYLEVRAAEGRLREGHMGRMVEEATNRAARLEAGLDVRRRENEVLVRALEEATENLYGYGQ